MAEENKIIRLADVGELEADLKKDLAEEEAKGKTADILYCESISDELSDLGNLPTIDPKTLRPVAHIIRGYVPETKDGVFCDGCNHCLGWEYGAHVIGYFRYCPYCGDRLEDGTEEET